VDLVLGGTDILAAGIAKGIWMPILPRYAEVFPHILERYRPEVREMEQMAHGQALAFAYMPAGPLLEYDPDRIGLAPATTDELLAWCIDHPGRFAYARPSNSGPGRAFLMGLPYLLGDADPRDPGRGWDRTWAYLRALGSCIDYYPSGTAALMRELGDGSRDMTVTGPGWDINPRALGIVPRDYRVRPFLDMTWIDDAQYLIVPKGVPARRLAVVLDVMKFLLEPNQQALAYDDGYFYPGPAIDDVPLTLAPARSQDVIQRFGRREYDDWFAQWPHTRPLDAERLVYAVARWNREIGGPKLKN
jgi:putative spermidine/putrescine transport system substrate-binding protein